MFSPDTILLELQYFPPIQYFSKLLAFPTVLIEQHEHYQKGSYRNRCHLIGSNGVQRLSIPLKKGKNQQQSITKTRISYDEPWQAQHWQSIQSAYGNAPFFEFYEEDLKLFFKIQYEYLWDWNTNLLNILLDLLSMDCELHLTNKYLLKCGEEILDFRNSIHPKPRYQRVDSQFVQAKYGQVFEEKHGFVPNLSILDLLFCTGPQAIEVLRKSHRE